MPVNPTNIYDQQYALSLYERLNGVYNTPINDGGGPINGSMVYTRQFDTPEIYKQAARAMSFLSNKMYVDDLDGLLCSLKTVNDPMNLGIKGIPPILQFAIDWIEEYVRVYGNSKIEGVDDDKEREEADF